MGFMDRRRLCGLKVGYYDLPDDILFKDYFFLAECPFLCGRNLKCSSIPSARNFKCLGDQRGPFSTVEQSLGLHGFFNAYPNMRITR